MRAVQTRSLPLFAQGVLQSRCGRMLPTGLSRVIQGLVGFALPLSGWLLHPDSGCQRPPGSTDGASPLQVFRGRGGSCCCCTFFSSASSLSPRVAGLRHALNYVCAPGALRLVTVGSTPELTVFFRTSLCPGHSPTTTTPPT